MDPTGEGGARRNAYPNGQPSRRLALVVAYEGTNYAGFQLQTNQPTIQGEIETALNRLTGESIRIRAASRTDSGAHALGQVVDFQTASKHPADTFNNALNYYLPVDIRVQQAFEMAPEFHSRRDATSRLYRYQILNRRWPSPLRRRECHWIREPLQIEEMNLAAQDLVGRHDFRPLVPEHPPERSAARNVHRWSVEAAAETGDTIVIRCEANGFLRHQIRRANAILVEIGKGKWPRDAIKVILREDSQAGKDEDVWAAMPIPSLPAHGLCLVEVTYRDFWSKVRQQDETN